MIADLLRRQSSRWPGAAWVVLLALAFASMARATTDVDLVDAGVRQGSPSVGENYVSFTLRNAGTTSLFSVPISVRYAIEPIDEYIAAGRGPKSGLAGTLSGAQTFVPVGLAATGSTESFVFSAPWILPAAGPVRLTVEIVPKLVGDPDPSDLFVRDFLYAGLEEANLTFKPKVQTSSDPPFVPALGGGKLQTIFTPEDLGGVGGLITDMGIIFYGWFGASWSSVRIEVGETTLTTLGTNFAANYDVPTAPPLVVYDGSAIVEYDRLKFAFSMPFSYSGRNNLLITIRVGPIGSTTLSSFARVFQTESANLSTIVSTGPTDSPTGTQVAAQGIKAYFRALPRVEGASVLPLRAGHGLRPSVGSNVITTRLFNRGTEDLSAQSTALGFSVDGGTTWSTAEQFTPASFPPGALAVHTFAAPWSISAVRTSTLVVRAVQGSRVGTTSQEFVADVDIGSVRVSTLQPLLGTNALIVTLINHGDFDLDGMPLNVHYVGTHGSSSGSVLFTPSTLGTYGSSQDVTIGGGDAWKIFSAGPVSVRAFFSPGLEGDPDRVDEALAHYNVGPLGTLIHYSPQPQCRYFIPLFSTMFRDYKFQTTFSAAQVGATGEITEYGMPLTTAATGRIEYVRIEMGETASTQLTTTYVANYNIPTAPRTIVYEGPLTLDPGFPMLPLHRPFLYSGQNRLLVTVYVYGSTVFPAHAKYDTSIGTECLFNEGEGDAPIAAYYSVDGGVPASFRVLPRINGPAVAVRDIRLNGADMAQVGSNTITARVWNRATSGGLSQNIQMQYSLDNGSTWSTSQSFPHGGLAAGQYKDCTFSIPATIAALGEQRIMVRINPAIGPDYTPFSKTYRPDPNFVKVGTLTPFPVIGQNTIRITLRNSGNFTLNGVSIPLRYSVDYGETWLMYTAVPTALGEHGLEETFDVLQAFSLAAPRSVRIMAEITPTLAGDPDSPGSYVQVLEGGVSGALVRIGGDDRPMSVNGTVLGNTTLNGKVQTHFAPQYFAYSPGVITSMGLVIYEPDVDVIIPYVRIELGECDFSAMQAPGLLGHTFMGGYNVPSAPRTVVFEGPLDCKTVAPHELFMIPLSVPFSYSGQNGLLMTIYAEGGDQAVSFCVGTSPLAGAVTVSGCTDIGDAAYAEKWAFGGGAVVYAAFRVEGHGGQPRVELTGVAPGDFGLPVVGNNVLQVTLANAGTTNLNGVPVPIEISSNGGQTWTPVGSVMPTSLATAGARETFLVSGAWLVTASYPATLRVRIHPTMGIARQEIEISHSPDVDVYQVSTFPPNPMMGENYVGLTLINRAGSVSMNGEPITLRYTVDGGLTFVTETFVPSALDAPDSTESFVFSTPWTLTAAAVVSVRVEMLTLVPGDPDTSDVSIRTFPDAGQQTMFGGVTVSPTGYPDYMAFEASSLKYQYCLTPEMLAHRYGSITEFGIQFTGAVNVTWPSFRIQLGETSRDVFDFDHQSYDANYDLPHAPKTTVYDGPLTVTTTQPDQEWRVPLTTPFSYSGVNNLLVTIYFPQPCAPTTNGVRPRVIQWGSTTRSFRQFTRDLMDTDLPNNCGWSNHFGTTNGQQAPSPVVVGTFLKFEGLPPMSAGAAALSTGNPAWVGGQSQFQLTALQPFSHTFATVGPPSRTLSLAPGHLLPPGLTFNATTGELSGSPTPYASGRHVFDLRLTAGSLQVPRRITVDVTYNAPIISTSALPPAEAGKPYSFQLTCGGGNPPFTWSLTSGISLPPSFSIAPSTGVLSGLPTALQAGRFSVTLTVHDANNFSHSRLYLLDVSALGAGSVLISELDLSPTAPYIELTCTGMNGATHVDLADWRVVLWADSTQALPSQWSGFPIGAMLFPGDVLCLEPIAQPSTQDTLAMGISGFAPTQYAAAALLDPNGCVVDFVAIGSVSIASLTLASGAPMLANASQWVGNVALSSDNLSRASALDSNQATDWIAGAIGTPGTHNPGFTPAPPMIAFPTLPAVKEGTAFATQLKLVGGSDPITVTLDVAAPTWLSLTPSGLLAGTPPALSTGTHAVPLVVTRNSAVRYQSLTLTVDPAMVLLPHEVTVGSASSSNLGGTAITLPLEYLPSVSAGTGLDATVEIASPEILIESFILDPAVVSLGKKLEAWAIKPGTWHIRIVDRDPTAATMPLPYGELGRFHCRIDPAIAAATAGNVSVTLAPVATHDGNGTSSFTVAHSGTITLSAFEPTDANRDGLVDVVDVQLTVNLVLALLLPEYSGQGDTDGDAAVDVVDVQRIVNRILFGPNG